MSNTVEEKLQIALKTEMVGYSYYNDVAEMIEDEHGKNVFRHLAREEIAHIKMIMGISESVKAGKGWISTDEALGEPGDLTTEGLPIFVDGNELMERFKKQVSDHNAIAIALENEREAVEFYSAMLKGASNEVEKSVLTHLLEMEQNHFDLLRWEQDALQKSGYWADFAEFTMECAG